MTEKLTDEALEELAEELNNDIPLFPHEKRLASLAIIELLDLRRRATPSADQRAAEPKALRMPKLHPTKEHRLVCRTNGIDGYREGWNDAVKAMRAAALAQKGDSR